LRMHAALLADRGIIKLSGEDARPFLDGLVTSSIETVTPQRAGYAALLSPQGKILFDFLVFATPDALLLDCSLALAPALAKRLGFYKLRAKVTIAEETNALSVVAFWDGAMPAHGPALADPRLAALGYRAIVPRDTVDAVIADSGATRVEADAFGAHRIACGVPRGGIDFAYGDTFPHEADMDQLNGVDFKKGCYVGQEVVSRIEHRGTARTRIVPVTFEGFAPEPGTIVMAGEKEAGRLGSTADGRGLAMLRLDRIADAHAAGEVLTAAHCVLQVHQPAWASFSVPGAKAA